LQYTSIPPSGDRGASRSRPSRATPACWRCPAGSSPTTSRPMTCRAYDNPYADQTDVPLCDGYSMNVHDGNWEYPATQRFALPVGGHCPARHEGL